MLYMLLMSDGGVCGLPFLGRSWPLLIGLDDELVPSSTLTPLVLLIGDDVGGI
jgi:hypothetical protein